MAGTAIAAGIVTALTVEGLKMFCSHFNGDQTWECGPSEVPREINLWKGRVHDKYPQGRENCLKFMQMCQRKGYRFRIKAVKTAPFWTWYYEVIG